MGLPERSKPEDPAQRLAWMQEESFALGQWLLGATCLVTHEGPDLDALFSLVLAQLYRAANGMKMAQINFVPGSTRDFPKGVVALDIGSGRGLRSTPSGGVMLKAAGAGGSSCMAILRCLPEEECEILKTVVSEISKSDEDTKSRNTGARIFDEVYLAICRMRPGDGTLQREVRALLDSKKSNIFCTSIYDQFQSLKQAGMSEVKLYDFVFHWVEGTIERGKRRRRVHMVGSTPEPRMLFNNRLAIMDVGGGVMQSKALEKKGVELTLYCRQIEENPRHWTLVLHKAPHAIVDLEALFRDRMDDFEGIGVHPFMVGWTAEKGGGVWLKDGEDIEMLRDRFIERCTSILAPWFASPRH